MDQRTAQRAPDLPAATTREALRRAVGTRARRLLLAATLLLGAAVAAAMTAVEPDERTFAAVSSPVQLLMSVPLPFLGVLLGRDLRRSPGPVRVLPVLRAAVLLAAAVGVAGALLAALAVAAAPAGADPWRDAAAVALGGVLVQVLAQLVGTGLGLLLGPVLLACAATVVLPLGVHALLGAADALRPAREWLTPFAVAADLLSAGAGGLVRVRWLVVVLLWGAGLNALGAARLRRRGEPAGA